MRGRSGRGRMTIARAPAIRSVHRRLGCMLCRYACEEEAAQSKSSAKETRNLFLYTLLRCNIRLMIVQSALAACVSLCRVLTAVGFRQYVRWLLTQEGDETEGGPPSGWWYGWMWAGLLIVFQIGSVVGQNQQFWCGSRLGHRWTQQVRHNTYWPMVTCQIHIGFY